MATKKSQKVAQCSIVSVVPTCITADDRNRDHRMSKPDFILIGAPKSGTTSVYRYLQQHPRAFMLPLTERHFFLYDGPNAPHIGGPNDLLPRRDLSHWLRVEQGS